MATNQIKVPSTIGGALPRIDGPLKVSGAAKYSSDHHFPGMLYAVPVCSTIANGKIVNLDTAAAEKMPGVRADLSSGECGTALPGCSWIGFFGLSG